MKGFNIYIISQDNLALKVNGAATFQSRRLGIYLAPTIMDFLLQRSRNLSVTET